MQTGKHEWNFDRQIVFTCTPTDLMGSSVADNLHLLVILTSWPNSPDVIPELILSIWAWGWSEHKSIA